MHLISISVQALTLKLNPCPLLALVSSFMTLTMHEYAIVSVMHTPTQSSSSLSRQKPTLYKVRVVFYMPVHAEVAHPVLTMALSKASLAAKESAWLQCHFHDFLFNERH